MRRLTDQEIETLASRKNVKRIAVENFLMSFPTDLAIMYQIANLENDARSYGWNADTKRAIRDGLDLASRN